MLKFALVPLILACALVGTITIINGIDKAVGLYTSDKVSGSTKGITENITDSSEIKNAARNGVIRHSVRILRRKNLTDEQIKEKLLHSFSVSEEEIDKILSEEQSGTQI